MKFTVEVFICLIATCVLIFTIEAFNIKRSTDSTMCSPSTPCGWELYEVYTRTILSFVKSPCECPHNTHCMRWYDNLSKAAYVFRCSAIQKETASTTNDS